MKNQRVVTFLDRGEIDFLDKLGKDAFFSSGHKLPRATLIAWMVDIFKGLDVNGEKMGSREDLEKRLKEKLTDKEEGQ